MASYQVLRHPHSLSKALQNFLQTEEGCDFRRAMSLVPPNWKVYVMGGLPRDLLLRQIRGIDVKPTDIDLVVEGANSVAAVRDRLGAAYVSSNTFGGAKCQFRPEGIIFDIWRVEDHANSVIAFKPYTIEQLLKHNLLDVDAILWDPKTDSLHDCGCLNAIQ